MTFRMKRKNKIYNIDDKDDAQEGKKWTSLER